MISTQHKTIQIVETNFFKGEQNNTFTKNTVNIIFFKPNEIRVKPTTLKSGMWEFQDNWKNGLTCDQK